MPVGRLQTWVLLPYLGSHHRSRKPGRYVFQVDVDAKKSAPVLAVSLLGLLANAEKDRFEQRLASDGGPKSLSYESGLVVRSEASGGGLPAIGW